MLLQVRTMCVTVTARMPHVHVTFLVVHKSAHVTWKLGAYNSELCTCSSILTTHAHSPGDVMLTLARTSKEGVGQSFPRNACARLYREIIWNFIVTVKYCDFITSYSPGLIDLSKLEGLLTCTDGFFNFIKTCCVSKTR